MNIKIVKNKYWNSLLLLMLLSAIIHMVILFALAIVSGSFYVLNYFNILDIDLFYQNIFNNFSGNIFSLIIVGLIYLVILKTNKAE